MAIRFGRSGFCETLEQSYLASNGKLITKDFADQLNTKSMDPDNKYEMTEEELDDMLVWNWAEFLDHHRGEEDRCQQIKMVLDSHQIHDMEIQAHCFDSL